MKKFLLVLTVLFYPLIVSSQVFTLEPDDSVYQNRIVFDNNDTTNLWKFKDDLPKGEYWVIDETVCGPDTLKYAKYIKDGIKHGAWMEWEPRLCVGLLKEKSDEVEAWSFASITKSLLEVVTYDSGFLLKSTFYHISSNQPNWELSYPPKTTQSNQWIEENVWNNIGVHMWTTKIINKRREQHTDYYENGATKSQGHHTTRHGNFTGIWNYYYENGIPWASGKFLNQGRKKNKKNTKWRQPQGKWKFWDQDGQLIAEVTFRRGSKKKIRRYQEKIIPFVDLNKLFPEN